MTRDAALHQPDDDEPTEFVFGLLVSRHPTMFSLDELALAYARDATDITAVRVLIEDAVAELHRAGLAHRIDRFTFASAPAIAASDLTH